MEKKLTEVSVESGNKLNFIKYGCVNRRETIIGIQKQERKCSGKW
jgi:hypothetical protein